MSAEIVQFVPKANPSRTWPLARSEDHLALENERYRLNMASNADMAPADNAHRFVQPSIMENWGPIVVSDTAPSEYCAPDGDCA